MNNTLKGRGAQINPLNRFEEVAIERDSELEEAPSTKYCTQIFRDTTRSLISYNDSPDIPYKAGINPYRGCEHGCVYCFARPNHEYLGFSSGIDFETKILVKFDAPQLLRKELRAKSYKPQTITMSNNTDCYQPIERKLKITRGCLEVFRDFRNPVAVITKNKLILRDIDLLKELAEYNCVSVIISVTSLDPKITGVLEPRSSRPDDRLKTIELLRKAGIPAGVLVAPIVPAITDQEIPRILQACANAGAIYAGYVMLRLPFALGGIFGNWLEHHFPERKDKVLNRMKEMRGGKLYDAKFGDRMKGKGVWADQIRDLFMLSAKKCGINQQYKSLAPYHFRRDGAEQMIFF